MRAPLSLRSCVSPDALAAINSRCDTVDTVLRRQQMSAQNLGHTSAQKPNTSSGSTTG